MMSKTYIDYRKADLEDINENFTISNLIKDIAKQNLINITSKSSILAPYNTFLQQENNNSLCDDENDLFDDFNNINIRLENEIIGFNNKTKEYNMLYELNNNGEVDNGMLINSKTNTLSSSFNLNASKSHVSRTLILQKDESDNEEENKKNMEDEEENLLKEEKRKKDVMNEIEKMGYDKEYVEKCLKENILCHATAVYYLLMNYVC